MVDLLDIVAIKSTVPIRGKDLDITGISFDDFVALLMRFPELQKAFGEGMTAERIADAAPAALGAVIAAGTGHGGSSAHEQAARAGSFTCRRLRIAFRSSAELLRRTPSDQARIRVCARLETPRFP